MVIKEKSVPFEVQKSKTNLTWAKLVILQIKTKNIREKIYFPSVNNFKLETMTDAMDLLLVSIMLPLAQSLSSLLYKNGQLVSKVKLL